VATLCGTYYDNILYGTLYYGNIIRQVVAILCDTYLGNIMSHAPRNNMRHASRLNKEDLFML